MKEQLKSYIVKEFGESQLKSILKENCLHTVCADSFHKVEYLLNKANVARLQTELKRVYKLLSDSGVWCITFKGVALAHLLYDDIYTRCFGDIDIYVFPKDFEKAMDLLRRDGYGYRYPDTLSNRHHVVFENREAMLELHRHIHNPIMGIDEAYMLSHTRLLNLGGQEIRTFDITATFLHLLYHLYMDTAADAFEIAYVFENKKLPKAHRFLQRAYEIAAFAKKYVADINWNDVEEEIEKQNVRILFRMLIHNVLDVFPNAFPVAFVKAVDEKMYLIDSAKHEIDVLYRDILDGRVSLDMFLREKADTDSRMLPKL